MKIYEKNNDNKSKDYDNKPDPTLDENLIVLFRLRVTKLSFICDGQRRN